MTRLDDDRDDDARIPANPADISRAAAAHAAGNAAARLAYDQAYTAAYAAWREPDVKVSP